MDGRLRIANDDILPLLQLATANDKYEDRRGALKASRGTRALGAIKHRIDRINMERRSKRNVAHHYDLSARLYASNSSSAYERECGPSVLKRHPRLRLSAQRCTSISWSGGLNVGTALPKTCLPVRRGWL